MSDQTTKGCSRKATKGRSEYFVRRLGRIAGLVALAVSSSIGRYDVTADCTVAPSGLVSWWRAEGDALDSAAGNHGTLNGAAPFAPAGISGQAFKFNGLADKLDLGDPPSLRLTNAFTIEGWILASNAPTGPHSQILFRGDTRHCLDPYYFSLQPSRAIRLHIAANEILLNPCGVDLESAPVPLNQWLHVAGVFDGNSGSMSIFIDGVLAAQMNTSVRPFAELDPAYTPAVVIGNTIGFTDQGFNGLIDELAIYNRALSSNEIAGIFLAASAGKCPTTNPPPASCTPAPSGLVSWWQGESNAADTTGGNNGQLTGATTFASGQVGQAFVFDGVDGLITVPASPSLNVGLGAGLTIETWIKPSAIELERPIAEWNSVTGGNPYPYGVHFWISVPVGYGAGPGCLYANLVDTAGNFHWLTSAGGLINTNSFQHVAVTYDQSSGLAVLLLNGAVVAQQNLGSFTPQTSYNLYLGGRPGGVAAAYRWAGSMDEVSLYSRALSQTEIQAIYAAGSAGKCVVVNPPPPYLLAGPITNAANGHWYYLLDATNWPAAEEIGVSLGGHLATINNAAENEWVFTNFSTFGGGDHALWVGLSDSGQENIWQWISGAPATYLNWAPGEPNSGGGFFPDEDHVLIWNPTSSFPPGSWNDAPSNQLFSAVIEVGPPEPVILGGPITNAANGHWYFLLNFTNWPAAEQIAVSLGGHLATINDAVENTWVFDTFSTFGGLERAMWIGLNDSAQEGDWGWVSGEPVTFLNWSPIEPNSGGGVFPDEDHALIWHPSSGYPLGSWNDAPSNQLQYAVVEVAPPPPVSPVIVSQPTTVTVYVGSNAIFRVTATGDAPLSYQWRLNGNDLPGKTSSVLSLTSVQFGDAGPYSVGVSNAGGSITSSNAVLTVNPLPDCTPPPAGLVSWWRAEGTANDDWDSNDGRGFATNSGKVGSAFFFSGRSVYVLVNDSPSLRFTNALTLEAWVNPRSVSGTGPQTIISKFDYPLATPVGTQSAYLLGTTDNGLLFFTVSATGSAQTNTTLVTTQALPSNQWSFVVATYDGVALRLYFDGTLAAQTNYSDGIFPGTASLGIGAIQTGPSVPPRWGFSGLLDEVSLYNRALTDGEIQAIFNADVVGKCLVAPTIVTQPQDQAIPLGEDVKFTVSVLGTRPLKYQWRFNGTNLANATNSALVLEKLQTNRVGNYSVFVSNAVGSATSSNATLTLLPAPVCTESPASLISWWPGDTNLFDVMGRNNISGFSPELYATGKVDRAFSFNGTSSRIYFLFSLGLDFGVNVDFSIEMWIKAGASNTVYPNVPLFEKRSPGASWLGYSLSLNHGRLAFAMGSNPFSATNVSSFTSSGPDLRDGMFHHVAVSVNRTNPSGGHLYVDGQDVLTFDPTPRKGSLGVESSPYIGAPGSTTTNSYFGGLIDEPAIYNRALTASEILAIRQAGAAGKCKVKPSILVQPVSQRVTIGSNATFSITAAGTPSLRYQWLFDGNALIGATSPSLSFTVQTNSGGEYSVRVTNVFGVVESSSAVLTVNNAPVAADRSVEVLEDTGAVIGLSASDPDGDRSLTFMIVVPPAHGTLAGRARLWTYTPARNYNGPDSFTYVVNDGLVDSAPATVSITVLPVNDPPVAQTIGVLIDEDTTLALTLRAFDVDGDPLTFTVGTPAHGTLTGTPPNLTYRPDTNYDGLDSFTFSVSDGQTNSGIATVTIRMRPVNDLPVAVSQSVSVNEDTNLVINLVAFDVDGDALTYTVGAPTNGTLTGTAPNLTYTPKTNYHGPDSFTFSVSDGAMNSEIATVDITVLPVNDPPVADASATVTLVISPNNSNATVVLDGSRSSDVDGDSLQYLWFTNSATNAFGTGIVAVVVLPVGTNLVTLQVNDGLATDTNLVTVNVLTVSQALLRLKGLAQSAQHPRPLVATLDLALFVAQHGHPKLAISLLGVFQLQVRAQVLPADSTLAESLIREARRIINALVPATTHPHLAISPAASLPVQGRVANPANLSLRLQFSGESGRAYLVEASTNLIDWEKIGVATEIGEGDFGFEETHAAHWPRCFYRVVAW